MFRVNVYTKLVKHLKEVFTSMIINNSIIFIRHSIDTASTICNNNKYPFIL